MYINKNDLKLMCGYMYFYKTVLDQEVWERGCQVLEEMLSTLFSNLAASSDSREELNEFYSCVEQSPFIPNDFKIMIADKLKDPKLLLSHDRRVAWSVFTRDFLEIDILIHFYCVLNRLNGIRVQSPELTQLHNDQIKAFNQTIEKGNASLSAHETNQFRLSIFKKPVQLFTGALLSSFLIDRFILNDTVFLKLFLKPMEFFLRYMFDAEQNDNLMISIALIVLLFMVTPAILIASNLAILGFDNYLELQSTELQEVKSMIDGLMFYDFSDGETDILALIESRLESSNHIQKIDGSLNHEINLST